MPSAIETLPDKALDSVVSQCVQDSPSLRTLFLAQLGRKIHHSAIRVLFSRDIILPDDERYFDSELTALLPRPTPSAAVLALIANPERYGKAVKRIQVQDPLIFASLDDMYPYRRLPSNSELNLEPLHASSLDKILDACGSSLEEFIWTSTSLPPDGLCESLAMFNMRLNTFIFQPVPNLLNNNTPSGSRPTFLRWDALSLPMLSSLSSSLVTLRLSRLSQAGSKALSALLTQLEDDSALEDVSLDFLWLDDALCEKLANAGRRIRRLDIGTCGTKLSDRGILELVENCESLEGLGLIEVQGRLTRQLWSKVDTPPPALTSFKVYFSESGPHHSWTADHLLSLPSESFTWTTLKHLCVSRAIRPFDSQVDDVATLRPIPREIVGKIREAKGLSVLECDWWSWKAEDIKVIFDACDQLEVFKLAFDGAFGKLLTSTSVFTSAVRLRKLCVSVAEQHTPPPASSPGINGAVPLISPTASPVLMLRGNLPALEVNVAGPEYKGANSGNADIYLPALRDIKKFARRSPNLTQLEWYGRNGRGRWSIERTSTPTGSTQSKPNSSNLTNINIEFCPASLVSMEMWDKVRREEEAVQSGWAPSASRVGQMWTGPNAEEAAAAAEREREEALVSSSPRLLTINLSSSGSRRKMSMSSNTSTDPSLSPLQPFTPLSLCSASPPPLDSPVSTIQVTKTGGRRTSVSSVGGPWTQRSTSRTGMTDGPRRAPSEPSLRANGNAQAKMSDSKISANTSPTEPSRRPKHTGEGQGRGWGTTSRNTFGSERRGPNRGGKPRQSA